jgi:hypothetical protein
VKRTGSSFLRRTAAWAASALLGLAVAALAASALGAAWHFGGPPGEIVEIALDDGVLWACNDHPVAGKYGLTWECQPPRGLCNWWWPGESAFVVVGTATDGALLWAIVTPLWMAAAAPAVVLLAAWLGQRRVRSIRRGAALCLQCAYDLAGVTGPCPECGSARELEA